SSPSTNKRSTPIVGAVFLKASAIASWTATPEAPSLAPGTGSFVRAPLSLSAMGRVSQWVKKRSRREALGLNRAMKFLSSIDSPFLVTWVQVWTTTESALVRRTLSSQAAIFWWPGVPGIRGPKSSCALAYANAAWPSVSLGGGGDWHPTRNVAKRRR